jgi:hypothetical protein
MRQGRLGTCTEAPAIRYQSQHIQPVTVSARSQKSGGFCAFAETAAQHYLHFTRRGGKKKDFQNDFCFSKTTIFR